MKVNEMRDLSEQDLFDVLEICFREDSYTELIANILENDEVAALAILREWFPGAAPEGGRVKAETRVCVRMPDGTKVLPDLVIRCGDDLEEMYVVEAKIEAAEGPGQTKRYLEAKERMVEAFPGAAIRGYGFLTLEERNAQSAGVDSLSYRPIADHLTPDTFSNVPWMRLATECLRDRLTDYYRLHVEMHSQPYGRSESLGEHLARLRGLVTPRDVFHWFMEAVGSRAEFLTEKAVAQSLNSAHPLVVFYHEQWRSALCSLGQSYSIHMEVQLDPEQDNAVFLMLHYETNPYEASLARNHPGEVGPYWARRVRFAEILNRHMAAAELPGWTECRVPAKMPTNRNRNLLSLWEPAFSGALPLGELATRLEAELKSMGAIIDSTVAEWLK
jgi:hypothetical protein